MYFCSCIIIPSFNFTNSIYKKNEISPSSVISNLDFSLSFTFLIFDVELPVMSRSSTCTKILNINTKFNWAFLTTRNIAFFQTKNPWEKARIPGKRDVCEGFSQGRNLWQNRSSQTFSEGLYPWEKNEGLNPWHMSWFFPCLYPWHIPSLFSATVQSALTADWLTALADWYDWWKVKSDHNLPGTREGFNPWQMVY